MYKYDLKLIIFTCDNRKVIGIYNDEGVWAQVGMLDKPDDCTHKAFPNSVDNR